MEGTARGREDGTATATTATVQVELLDFRQVEGIFEPFRRVVRFTGLMGPAESGAGSAESEDTKQARAEMARLLEQLQSMPPEQRKMAEAQIGPMMKRMQAGMDQSKIEVVTTVKTIRIDRGPPDED
jgi:hypothetical protein